MKLVTYCHQDRQRVGAAVDDHIVDIGRASSVGRHDAELPTSILELLAGGDDLLSRANECTREVLAKGALNAAEFRERGVLFRLSDVRLAPPVPRPAKIICLGRNYRAHAEEANMEVPQVPELFSKYLNTLIGHGDAIVIPPTTSQVDYEAELAVVIGKRGRHIREADAMSHVAGYTIFNDVSARDYQFRTSQWMAGKTFDTFGPMGPWITTRDDIPDPHALRIKLDVDGDVLQDGTTADLIFSIPAIIAYISTIVTLEPGDVISTGTPAGVGFVRKPPRFLQAGETVRITIDGIGTLENRVTNT
jgi:acylpyruvate hydrolase